VTEQAPTPGSEPTPEGSESEREPIVIVDKRKIDASGQPRAKADRTAPPEATKPEANMGKGQPKPAGGDAGAAKHAEVPEGNAADAKAAEAQAADAVAAEVVEVESLRSELDERLRDLQRVTAEYANYRKRVERDRSAVGEQAVGTVITALLPILDDLDRARDHDDLVGPAAAMAEQLSVVLSKFGLTGFGEVGDAFDPTRHEAVAHQTSAEVTVPTCVAVMRRGYLLGERLLRAAMVAVADPE
jgi:molecular chaperone GrpE